MRKYFLIIVTIICLALSVLEVSAATPLFSVGTSADNNLVELSSTGILSGVRADYEVFPTTGDSLTAIESGKTFIFTETRGTANNSTNTNGKFVLPAASLGLDFRFVVASNAYVIVDVLTPATERIIWTEGVVSGDSLISPGATGDYLRLICGDTNTWYVAEMAGTWTDGNAY